jgi:1,4-dihydroxy-2-naphthoate polyprenyltransferase
MTASPANAPGRVRAWVMAARPATLPAAVAPVLVGTAVAVHARHFRALPFLAALVAAVLIQIGTNFANDLFDYHKGADTTARLGPVRVTQSGLISARAVAYATALTFSAAVLVGLYLVAVGGLPILLIGVASIAAAILYTGGPWPLGYHGLGDVFVFIFFGLIAVTGSYYVQAGAVGGAAIAAAVTAILVVNNVRDIETDRAAGKRTLAVRLGRRASRVQYALLVATAYAVPLLLWLAHVTSWLFWLPWLTAPLAYQLIRTVSTHADGPTLNRALKGTGRLHLLFGLLFAASLL